VGGSDAQLAKFLAGEAVDLPAAMRDLRGADPALAARVVLRLAEQPHWLPHLCADLPVTVLRAVVAAETTGARQLFLRLAVPTGARAAELHRAWRRAIDALAQLGETALALDHDLRRSRLAALAADPHVLAIVQGVVANVADPPVEMLAVLAIDGGDLSLDALIPHLEALARRDVRLERLAQLRGLARRTPALDAVFAELDGALAERRRTSPALALAAGFGVRGIPVLACSFRLASIESNQLGVPRVQGHASIDSRTEPWLTVWMSSVRGTLDRTLDAETRLHDTGLVADGLGLGGCAPADLPAWLATAARTLQIQWQDLAVVTNLDRDASAKLLTWLRAATAR
jgi:hypothetical protein